MVTVLARVDLGLGLGAKIVQLLITVFSHIFAC